MGAPSAKVVVTAIGVAGSLASVAALFVTSGDTPPAVGSTPSAVQTAPAATEQVDIEPPASKPADIPEKTRIPPVSGLLFSEARELLLRQGWFPINNPANPTANEDLMSGNGPYFVEKGYREVIACSGTGLAPCKFAYRSEAGQILSLVTTGEGEYARVRN
jgi:hypothetical protein